MKKYVIALDEGTTSTRTILFDRDGGVVGVAQREFTQFFPNPGWVEHDPMEIYAGQYATMTEVIAASGVEAAEIAAIGITNQRETTVVWDKATGKPIYNAIVWQCRRTADVCEKLKADGYEEFIRERTGLKIDAYFSATKIAWILDHVEGARERAEKGELLFGTIDTWLIWKLTDGLVHATDRTNASRTMLYNIHTLSWDKELLDLFRIPASMLPEVKSSGEVYAEIDLFGCRVPIAGVAGDQQAALFGQKCFEKGDVKNTYGTGCFLLMNTGHEPCTEAKDLVVTVAATRKEERPVYALEGSVFVGGAAIQWLRDEMGLITEARDCDYFASKVADTDGVYVVPAFTGLGAPYWDMYARGVICGLTRGSGRNHIIRATLESVAYQTADLIAAMEESTGIRTRILKADGGASASNLLMQFQSDISDVEVVCCKSKEATALGAAFLAGLTVGFWQNTEELEPINAAGRTFSCGMSEETRRRKLNGWHDAVRRAKSQ